jgi:hypothetical protein
MKGMRTVESDTHFYVCVCFCRYTYQCHNMNKTKFWSLLKYKYKIYNKAKAWPVGIIIILNHIIIIIIDNL